MKTAIDVCLSNSSGCLSFCHVKPDKWSLMPIARGVIYFPCEFETLVLVSLIPLKSLNIMVLGMLGCFSCDVQWLNDEV